MKKILVALVILTILFCSSAFADEPEIRLEMTETYSAIYEESADQEVTLLHPIIEQIETVEKQEVPLYIFSASEKDTISLYFINGISDIPFLDVRDLPNLLNLALSYEGESDNAQYTADSIGPLFQIYRENGSAAMIDFYAETITFTDMDAFNRTNDRINSLDIVTVGNNTEDDEINLIKHEQRYYRNGSVKEICLKDYGIPMLLNDGAGYIPLQTVSDLFMSPWNYAALYNGHNVMLMNASLMLESENSSLYHTGEYGMKSDALTAFTYQELCMALDLIYGLKDEHGIESFDSYFIQTNLASKLLSNDPEVTADGLAELCVVFFADGHSALDVTSYLNPGDATDTNIQYLIGPQFSRLVNMNMYSVARMEYYPDFIVPGYEEFGDTAYLTFDQFVLDYEKDYYMIEPENNGHDVIELLMYANGQIHRENSPIRNIVIDLSQNSGGLVDAAVAVISWFLGSCNLSLEDTATGGAVINNYAFDADRDHTINLDKDSVYENYRLFCIISPCSFSCGNLVPAAFKVSNCVTLLGRPSGGGTCTIYTLSTADGNLFRISGNIKLNTMNNGIFYSLDQGVEPDIVITDLSHLYDREYLTDYINTLP